MKCTLLCYVCNVFLYNCINVCVCVCVSVWVGGWGEVIANIMLPSKVYIY